MERSVGDSSKPDRFSRTEARRRRSTKRRRRVAVVVSTAVVAAATTVGLAYGRDRDGGCSGALRELHLNVAPELVPTVQQAAARAALGSCTRVSVTGADPASVAKELTDGGSAHPDIWIPDSSMWLSLRGTIENQLAVADPSIARSPVVLATQPASSTTKPGANAAAVLERAAARLSLPDPSTSAPAVLAVTGIQSAFAGRPDARALVAGVLRSAQRGASTQQDVLLSALDNAQPSTLAPVSEQAMWAHRATSKSSRLLATYLPASTPALDYPFVLLNGSLNATTAATKLLGFLQSADGQELLREHGFRDRAGRAARSLGSVSGLDASYSVSRAGVASDRVIAAIALARAVTLPARILAVVDVSGSMGEKVPGANGATRLALTKKAALGGLRLQGDDAQIGLWEFSSRLVGSQDFREVVPVGPLTTRRDGVTGRAKLWTAVTDLNYVPGGGTGLYDTVLAAVRRMRSTWDPSRVNSVVVLTDGRNDDGGVTLAQLLRTLAREGDPEHPVPVISIVLGPDGDEVALRAISDATGGSSYVARDPRDIAQVFLDAVAQRSCRPNCPR